MARPKPIFFQDRMGYVGDFRLEPDQLDALLDLVAAPAASRPGLCLMLQDIAATHVADFQGENGPLPRPPKRAQSRIALDHVVKSARKAKMRPSALAREELRWRLAGLDDTAGFRYRIRSAEIWHGLGGDRRQAFEFPGMLASHPDLVIEAATWAKEQIPARPGPDPDPDLHLVVQRLLGVYSAGAGERPTATHYDHGVYDGAAHSAASEFCRLFFSFLPVGAPRDEALATTLVRQLWPSKALKKRGDLSVR